MGYDPNGAKSISPLQTARSSLHLSPPSDRDRGEREREKPTYMGLLKAVMSVCAADGKILRLPQLARDSGMSEENFLMALQRICDIIGYYRLAINISQDVIMSGVSLYIEQYVNNENGSGSMGSSQGQGGGMGGMGGQNQNAQAQANYRLHGLGVRADSDPYARSYGQGQNGGQWQGPSGVPGGQNRSAGQRTSFNFDSYENNMRGTFPLPGSQNQGNYNQARTQLHDAQYQQQNRGSVGVDRSGYGLVSGSRNPLNYNN